MGDARGVARTGQPRLGNLIAQEEVWRTLWRKVVMIFLVM